MEVTAKQIFGYILIGVALSVLLYVGVAGLLLTTGITQPLHVPMSNPGYGNDVLAGILLQIGVYGIFVGVVFVLSNIGYRFVKDKEN